MLVPVDTSDAVDGISADLEQALTKVTGKALQLLIMYHARYS
jgi:hypothetical protein